MLAYEPTLEPSPRSGNGGASRDRTDDPLLAKQVLSQLSYGPLLVFFAPGCVVSSRALGHVLVYAPSITLDTPCQPQKIRRRLEAAALKWWVWVDLNHRPHPYQGCALTN